MEKRWSDRSQKFWLSIAAGTSSYSSDHADKEVSKNPTWMSETWLSTTRNWVVRMARTFWNDPCKPYFEPLAFLHRLHNCDIFSTAMSFYSIFCINGSVWCICMSSSANAVKEILQWPSLFNRAFSILVYRLFVDAFLSWQANRVLSLPVCLSHSSYIC